MSPNPSQMIFRAAACVFCCALCAALLPDVAAQSTQKKRSPAVRQVGDEADPLPRRPAPKQLPTQEEPEAADEAPPANTKAPIPEKKPRPAPQELRVPKLDPQLEEILDKWEASSSQIKRLTGTHHRTTYESTFGVEMHAEGKFLYEAPDSGCFSIVPVKIPKAAVSKKLKPNGAPYDLKTDKAERWICTGKEVFQINDGDKTFDVVVIPPESRGQNIIDGPLPFLFGMKAAKAKVRYQFTLVKNASDSIRLDVKPLLQQDFVNWQTATVILDPETFLPTAVRLICGNQTKVHTFENVVKNGKRPFWEGDPLKPDLKSYKPVIHETVQAAGGEAPPKVTTKPRATQSGNGPPQGSAKASDAPPAAAKKKSAAKSDRN